MFRVQEESVSYLILTTIVEVIIIIIILWVRKLRPREVKKLANIT